MKILPHLLPGLALLTVGLLGPGCAALRWIDADLHGQHTEQPKSMGLNQRPFPSEDVWCYATVHGLWVYVDGVPCPPKDAVEQATNTMLHRLRKYRHLTPAASIDGVRVIFTDYQIANCDSTKEGPPTDGCANHATRDAFVFFNQRWPLTTLRHELGHHIGPGYADPPYEPKYWAAVEGPSLPPEHDVSALNPGWRR